jgi:hypothetical protein
MKKKLFAWLTILAATSLLMVACSAQEQPTAAPTIDANLIYTQAAQTVQAEIDQTEAAKPVETSTPTPAPTFTMDPNTAAGLTATAKAVLQPGAATPTGQAQSVATATGQATPLVLPTATPGVIVQKTQAPTGDKCEWVANSPADNSSIPINASFDAVIKVKNSGTTTWDQRYALRYYAGERMGVPSDYFVTREVKPNETFEFAFPMKAPGTTGDKEVLMVIQNPDARNMCFINLPLKITE